MLGEYVALDEGCLVGANVGLTEGLIEGAHVGARLTLGAIEVDPDGLAEESLLGDDVGTSDGDEVAWTPE